jgi:hypothetical protein
VFAADSIGVVTLLRAVALEGDALPIEGATIRSFPSSIDPSIDGSGRVVFRALIAGATDPPRPSGVFMVQADGLITRITTVRDVIQGIGTVSRLRDPVIADDGSVVVSMVIAGVGPGLFIARDGDLVPLAVLGDATDADAGDSRFRFGSAAVTTSAEGAAFLGERDAIFGTDSAGGVTALAYTGRPSRLGGIMASLGPPVVDTSGRVFFGVELQRALFNEVLLVAEGDDLDTFISPDRRLLGGGGIAEFFPTNVDALARPNSAPTGVVFTAALQGAKASEAVFLARSRNRTRALLKVGQRASGQRITGLGTPAVGGRRSAVALLAEVGRESRRAVVMTGGGVSAARRAAVPAAASASSVRPRSGRTVRSSAPRSRARRRKVSSWRAAGRPASSPAPAISRPRARGSAPSPTRSPAATKSGFSPGSPARSPPPASTARSSPPSPASPTPRSPSSPS